MEKRLDEGFAFILQYKNIDWYEDGVVLILDRRIYPIQTKFVECRSHLEVAKSIKDMVTQSWRPFFAAGMGMVLACHEAKDLRKIGFIKFIHEAGISLYSARPTTSALMKQIVETSENSVLGAKATGKDAIDATFNTAVGYYNEGYTQTGKMGAYLAEKFPQKGTIMTQYLAETVVGMVLKEIRKENKDIKFFCPETRPYFQGARLTASCIRDMDFDVTVITDNMPGYVLKKKNTDVFTSAADVVCMDGTVVNKVGTFQIALCSNYYGIPYYATGIPNIAYPGSDPVTIEERDPNLTMYALDVKTTMDSEFCISTLERAIRKYGTPEIFNSDQSSQFTSKSFREVLEEKHVKISMDGKGRALDNIVIERFWRTIKYADIYLKDYGSAIDASEGISKYIEKYNMRRPHESLGKRTPDEVYGMAG